MNILFVKMTRDFFGGEKQAKEWMEGLNELGHKITLLTLPNGELAKQTKNINVVEFNLFPYPDTRLKSLWFTLLLPYHWSRAFFCLNKIKKNYACRVICVQDPFEKITFSFLAHILGLKVVWLDVASWKPYLVNNIILMIELKLSACFVDLIIASSQHIYTEMKEIFPKHRITVLHHVLMDKEVAELVEIPRASYPIRTIGYIGNISQMKGVITLLDAFKNLLLKNKDIKLIYAGSGLDEADLISKIKEYKLGGQVKLLGKVPKVDFFKQADLVVVPSHFDNVPYVLHEAMFTQRMVIASRVGGIPEIFSKDSQKWLVEPNNAKELTQRIEEALSLKRVDINAITNRNYLKINELTNYPEMIRQVEETFQNTINQL